jgi:hypothetical protein
MEEYLRATYFVDSGHPSGIRVSLLGSARQPTEKYNLQHGMVGEDEVSWLAGEQSAGPSKNLARFHLTKTLMVLIIMCTPLALSSTRSTSR